MELSQIADIVTNGGNPGANPEFENWGKWAFILRLYDLSRNPKFGNLEHLPCAGGLLDQPVKTMEALEICCISYQKKISKDMENLRGKVRR